MDVINKAVSKAPASIKTALDHNRWLTAAILAVGLLVGVVAGCQPHTTSPISGKQVTRQELNVEATQRLAFLKAQIAEARGEIDRLKTDLPAAEADLDAKAQAMMDVLTSISTTLGPTAGPWGGVVTAGLSTLLLGSALNSRRKDAVIAESKTAKTARA